MKSQRWILVAPFVVSVAGAFGAQPDHELLQGSWVCVSTARDGEAVRDYVGVKAVIEADRLTWFFPLQGDSYRKQVCNFRIDPGANPKQFDWWRAETPERVDRRVYTLDDDVLRLSTNLDYKTRPQSLESGRWIFAMQRSAPPAKTLRGKTIPGWGTVVDPDGDCTIRPRNGMLVISVPGTKHDLFYGGPDVHQRFNAPRVLQSVEGDFVARVKVTGDWRLTPEASSYNGAGLVVWDSENQYLRFERNRYYRGSEPRGPHSYITPLYDHNQNRGPVKTASSEFFTGRSTWLRIERTGNQISTATSADGNAWTPTGILVTQFPKRVAVGVFVINTSPLGFVAEFADFKLLKE